MSETANPNIGHGHVWKRADGLLARVTEKALFIPLRAEWFGKIESGEKNTEYRAYGPRWNEKSCRVGRAVTLSRGYGKAHRLSRAISSFVVLNWADAPPEARQIYPDAAFIAAIGLDEAEPQ